MSAEALARKARSIKVLKSEKVPYIEHLPLIETEAESTRRTSKNVAMRAMALSIVAAKGHGLKQETVAKLVKEYKLASVFSPEESAFIKNASPKKHDRIQFSWRYESYWVMLWALGFIAKLDRPDSVCDVERAVSILRHNGHDGFLKKAKLRPQRDILDAADLIYRYHWAARDAHINGRDAPAGLEGGVVYERHRALNWLIGYMDQEWDEVTTDT